MRKRTKLYAAAVGLATTGALMLSSGGASGHGYTDLPVSRAEALPERRGHQLRRHPVGAAERRGPEGLPSAGPADGKLCSAGNASFAPLDAPRTPSGGAWPTTRVTGGQDYTFRWQFTAMHATTDFKYYVTKPGWNQNHNLSRSDLNLTPFLTVPYNGQRPPQTLSHSGRLPTGLSGHHVILAVWTVHDTGNAFYACSDVTF